MRPYPLILVLAACGAEPEPDPAPPITASVAFVIESDESYMLKGSEGLEGDDDAYPGIYDGLVEALDGGDFARWLPRGTTGVVLGYDEKVHTIAPRGPIEQMRGSVLGARASYHKRFGVELVRGIEAAGAELVASGSTVKVMIVIGDGNDTNFDTAPARLAALRERLVRDQILLIAVIYRTLISEQTSAITALVPDARRIDDPDELSAALRHAALRAQLHVIAHL